MMRGSGGNLNHLLAGVGVHVDDGTTRREKWQELLQEREKCVSGAD